MKSVLPLLAVLLIVTAGCGGFRPYRAMGQAATSEENVFAQACPSIKAKRVSPHTVRHTTAMHLLQSGNDIYVVKDWLGHADVNTTHAYVEIDMKMKHKALESCQPPKANTPPNSRPKWLKPGILEWLENVSKGAGNYVESWHISYSRKALTDA